MPYSCKGFPDINLLPLLSILSIAMSINNLFVYICETQCTGWKVLIMLRWCELLCKVMYNFISKNNTEIACGLYKSGYSILTFHKAFSDDLLILVQNKNNLSFLCCLSLGNALVSGTSANEIFWVCV